MDEAGYLVAPGPLIDAAGAGMTVLRLRLTVRTTLCGLRRAMTNAVRSGLL